MCQELRLDWQPGTLSLSDRLAQLKPLPIDVATADVVRMGLRALVTKLGREHGVVADPKLGADGPQHGFGNDLAV